MKQKPAPAKPTVEQLASLAATLSKWKMGDRVEPPGSLVSRAMAIWKEAQKLLNPPPPGQVQPVPPQPKRYPVTRDKFLGLVLPKLSGRTGDKYSLFREYLKFRLLNPAPPSFLWADELPGGGSSGIFYDFSKPQIDRIFSRPPKYPPQPTKDDVDELFANWSANSIPDSTSFRCHYRLFRVWYEIAHAAEVSAKHRAAGAKGLKSQMSKKNKSQSASGKQDKRKGARPHKEQLAEVAQAAMDAKEAGGQ
jgi:hypothetical protein